MSYAKTMSWQERWNAAGIVFKLMTEPSPEKLRVCNADEKSYTSVSPHMSLYAQPGLTLNSSTFCPHSVFMCFVWIWEQTAIISLYRIDWLVFITETECVYCAVRSTFYILPTEYIYVFCVDLRKTAIISLYGIDYLVIITQTECV